jgi:hypothetical protein
LRGGKNFVVCEWEQRGVAQLPHSATPQLRRFNNLNSGVTLDVPVGHPMRVHAGVRFF